jgi:cation diffusion facilitator family transporter
MATPMPQQAPRPPAGGTTGPDPIERLRLTSTGRIAVASIVVAFVVMAIKYLAYWRTGSVALLSDAIESIVNVATAVAALVAIRISRQPADRRHPFGHHKVEYFSAVLESALVIVAALLILHEAYQALRTPRAITAPVEGLLINGLATAINMAWAWVLLNRGRAWRSPALSADGRHLLSDVVSSVGVAAGVLIAVVSGWQMLDPLVAGVVAVHILATGWRLAKESLSGLMDEATDGATLARIKTLISQNAEGALEVHDLRTRVAARALFVEFHMVVPAQMTVAEAHAICDRVEGAIAAELPDATVLIHVEPEGEARHTGVLVL